MGASERWSWLRPSMAAICSIDLRSLALMRIGVACFLLLDLVLRAPFVPELLTDDGFLPRALLWETVPEFSPLQLHALSGGVALQWTLLGLQALLAVLFGLGLYTRAVCVLLWLIVTSLHLRHPYIIEGGDNLVRLLLFWCCLLPTGTRFSLDARRRARKAGDPDPPVRHTSLAALGIMVQVAAIYFFAGVAKSGSDWMVDANAVTWVVNDPEWTRFGAAAFVGHARLTSLLTVATIVFEWVIPPLLFAPIATERLRAGLLFIFWGFQAGLSLTMVVGLFPLINAIALLIFVPTWAWSFVDGTRGDAAPPSFRWRWRPSDAIAAPVTVFVLVLNIGHYVPALQWPSPVLVGARHLQIYQEWNLFGPNPRHEVPRVAIFGSSRAGKRIDILDPLRVESWEPFDEISRYYRFRYLLLLSDRHFASASLRRGFARYACSRWNATHQGREALYGIEVQSERLPIRSGQRLGPGQTRILSTHACADFES